MVMEEETRMVDLIIGEETMTRPLAADDFAAIRARMEELRRERERVDRAKWPEDERAKNTRMREIAYERERFLARRSRR
jgi:hypothetical protein